MATQMVRKQFYIQKRQVALLKRLARARGLSEAEIIRQAIERELVGAPVQPARSDLSAMEDFALLAVSKRAQGLKAKSFLWNREEIYEERESRWVRDRGEIKGEEKSEG
jgi:hypothetical protein